jgi:hypothetical protein
MQHTTPMPAVTLGAAPQVGSAGLQLDRDQLALIGATFMAGFSAGQGLPTAPPSNVVNTIPKPIVHGVPTLPIKLDGKRAAPDAVKDFDGKPLHWVVDEAALAGEVLSVFTENAKAQEFIAKQGAEHVRAAKGPKGRVVNIGTGSSPQEIADAIGGAIFLFQHINFGGSLWRFNTGATGFPNHVAGDGNINDLGRVFCFLWWCQNIAGQVSSIQNQSEVWADVRPARAFAVLHDQPNFGGSTFAVPQRTSIASLVPFGWNDRAASMSYRVV